MVGLQSLFRLHFCAVAEYSNEQQLDSLLHRLEQSAIVGQSVGLEPTWPQPGMSPLLSVYP